MHAPRRCCTKRGGNSVFSNKQKIRLVGPVLSIWWFCFFHLAVRQIRFSQHNDRFLFNNIEKIGSTGVKVSCLIELRNVEIFVYSRNDFLPTDEGSLIPN